MTKLAFAEDKAFFRSLDDAVRRNSLVIVTFETERPSERSKLWPRLRRTSGWRTIESDLRRTAAGEQGAMSKMVSKQMHAGMALGGGEIFLIAFIASLIAGVVAYAIYKGRGARVKFNASGEVELEITPA